MFATSNSKKIWCLFLLCMSSLHAQPAVVHLSVIDAAIADIPEDGGSVYGDSQVYSSSGSVRRIHQFLFNERLEVIEEGMDT